MRLSQLMGVMGVGCAANHANAYNKFHMGLYYARGARHIRWRIPEQSPVSPTFGSLSNAQSNSARLVVVVVLLGFLMRVGCGQSLETREAARARQRGLVRRKTWVQ